MMTTVGYIDSTTLELLKKNLADRCDETELAAFEHSWTITINTLAQGVLLRKELQSQQQQFVEAAGQLATLSQESLAATNASRASRAQMAVQTEQQVESDLQVVRDIRQATDSMLCMHLEKTTGILNTQQDEAQRQRALVAAQELEIERLRAAIAGIK